MRRASIAVALALNGCASGGSASRGASHDCRPSPIAERDAIAPSMLAGTFRLVQVLTSSPAERPDDAVWRATLRLAVPDSVQRAESRVRRIGHRPRDDLQLIGSVLVEGEREQPAELDAGVLYLGCRDCMDASPEILRIDAASAHGFVGGWADPQTGIARVVDRRTREPLPDPAGYFCAWRE